MAEFDSWQVQYHLTRQWLAEFPDVALTLEYLYDGASGRYARIDIFDFRETLRQRGHVARDRITSAAHRDVVAERARQFLVDGWTSQHDDKYPDFKLSQAAACYASQGVLSYPNAGDPPPAWPWAREWWKPKDYRSNLVRAGALILAEIERLDRATAKKCNEGE